MFDEVKASCRLFEFGIPHEDGYVFGEVMVIDDAQDNLLFEITLHHDDDSVYFARLESSIDRSTNEDVSAELQRLVEGLLSGEIKFYKYSMERSS